MLRFEIETEDADWWINVYENDCGLGQIYRSIFTGDILFTSSECGCSAYELTLIANKMKELEDANTKAN